MPDNHRRLSILSNVLFRAALMIAAPCLVIAAIPALIAVFIIIVLSPNLTSQGSGSSTMHLHVDLNFDHGRPNAEMRPNPSRPENSRPSQPSSHPSSPQSRLVASPRPSSLRNPQSRPPSSPRYRRASPHPSAFPAYTWEPQNPSTPPLQLDSSFGAQPPYIWQSTSAHVPPHANLNTLMPPDLPPISEPEQVYHYDPRRPSGLSGGPYTFMDPFTPARPRERSSSNFSWDADRNTTPSRPPTSRENTASSMPSQVPIVQDDSEDEAPPVYERPPEYDDEGHSQAP